jgi:solute carrier family 35 (UDP-xylose/UDP-N-acetylglucosamine transporter), member B4
MQVLSVLLVTFGVAVTTFSASNTKFSLEGGFDAHFDSYAIGIVLLSLALVLSGLLGLVQDKTFAAYAERSENGRAGARQSWQESMFLLHFLSLPIFWSARRDLANQFTTIHTGPRTQIDLADYVDFYPLVTRKRSLVPTTFSLPAAYIPLLLNTITQLFCVSGVHRLTTRVSSLTVTLVLVVRKAISLIISVLFLDAKGGQRENPLMWIGAALVLLGTVGYSFGSSQGKKAEKQKQE